MALAGLSLVPPLCHGKSEGCLVARRCAGAAQKRTTLPPLVESGRGAMRKPSSPQERPRKRSRSNTGSGSLAELDNSISPKPGSQTRQSQLSSSQSTGALGVCQSLDSEIEQVLATALTLSSKPEKPLALDEIEMEAHLEGLLNLATPCKKGSRRASISGNHGDRANNIRRKGTGFVHLSSLSPDVTDRHAKVDEKHVDKESNLHRKGTGFVHLPAIGSAYRARIAEEHGDKESNLRRKGTGFINLRSSPDKMDERRVKILDDHGDNENKIRRNSTGFVHLSSLPKDAPTVWFPDMTSGKVNHIQRKGTGFIMLNHPSPRVRIADSHGDNDNHIHRKGTGFIDLSGCDCSTSSSASCSVGTVDSPGVCQNASDAVVGSHENRHANKWEEQSPLIETM